MNEIPKNCGLLIVQLKPTTPAHAQFLGFLFGGLGGGTKSRERERSANFARRALEKKGGFLQSLRVSLLHFLVNFFRLVDRHFLRGRSRRAEQGGRIQCGVKECS